VSVSVRHEYSCLTLYLAHLLNGAKLPALPYGHYDVTLGYPAESRCPFHLSLRNRYSNQPLHAGQDDMFESHLPSYLQALFVQPRSPRIFACFARYVPEAGKLAYGAPRVLQATRQSLKANWILG